MINKDVIRSNAHLIISARHSKRGDDASIAPHDLTHSRILKTADELDSWIQESFDRHERKIQ